MLETLSVFVVLFGVSAIMTGNWWWAWLGLMVTAFLAGVGLIRRDRIRRSRR